MLALRALGDNDVPLVASWLNKPHVQKWYEIPERGLTVADWLREIKARKEEFCWLTYLIATWQGLPIGFCLYYKCVDSEEAWGALPLTGAYGIDYLIGDEAFLDKGLGKGMVKLLVQRVFSLPDAQRITAEVDKANKASAQTLVSCGFCLWQAEACRYVLQKR